MSKRVQVLLADDHAAFLQSLIASIPTSSSIAIVGEADNGETAVALARDLRPDVILLDFRMPNLDGAAAAVRILQQSPSTLILISSLSFDRQYLLRSLAAGASGYIAKDDAFVCLLQAIESVQAGTYYLSPRIQQSLQETAPPNPASIRDRVLQDFDKEGDSLFACSKRLAASDAEAIRAMHFAFMAYSLALREGETIPVSGAQTWLLLSVAALTSGRQTAPPARWSWWQTHPSDKTLEAYWQATLSNAQRTRTENHIDGCGSCRLAWSLAGYSIPADPGTSADAMRAEIARLLDTPDETAIFLAYAQRQFKVMQLASSELERLLGATARRDWTQREAAAGSWLTTLLGRTTVS